jgi:hypothetical protein
MLVNASAILLQFPECRDKTMEIQAASRDAIQGANLLTRMTLFVNPLWENLSQRRRDIGARGRMSGVLHKTLNYPTLDLTSRNNSCENTLWRFQNGQY